MGDPEEDSAGRKRQKAREERKRQAERERRNWPQYDACQDMEEQPFYLDTKTDTEAGFCLACKVRGLFGAGEGEALGETRELLLEKAFKEQLRKRVAGLIESRIFRIRDIRACWTGQKGSEEWRQTDPHLTRAVCEKRKTALQSAVESAWPEMRVNLTLSSPRLNETRFLSSRSLWLNLAPSHPVSEFSDSLPKLSPKEKQEAERLYVEAVSKTSLEGLTPEELKRRLRSGQPLDRPLKEDRGYVIPADKRKIVKVVQDLRQKSRDRYLEIIGEQPVLAYLNTDRPTPADWDRAFGKMEDGLRDFLRKVKDPKGDTGLLLSFSPLVEELLSEKEEYCLAGETARLRAEKSRELKDKLMMGAMAATLVPCFIGGPVAVSLCFAGGTGLSLWDVKEADTAYKNSLDRYLTGREFEKIAELKEKQKELALNKMFLPLVLIEAGSVVKAGQLIRESRKATGNSLAD